MFGMNTMKLPKILLGLCWGRVHRGRREAGTAAPSGRSYSRGHGCPGDGRESRRGVALIVVLGFLALMVMMAVAFLTQARIERMVAGASLEGMRTRQMAQSALAAGMQDYLNAVKEVPQSDPQHDIFLSGDLPVTLGFYYSGQLLGDDRLLIGKVEDWLLDWHLNEATGGGDDDIRSAEWIWVREQPGQRSRILGRYAYACFNMSGLIDANLLGTAYGDDVPDYGAFTNRNNVRKMLFDAVAPTPATGGDRQFRLNKHQRSWIGFDSPAALLNLTDGKENDGGGTGNRWSGVDIEEAAVGGIDVDDLSAYSSSVVHKEDAGGRRKLQALAAEIASDPNFARILGSVSAADAQKALLDYESTDIVPQGVDYPSVKNVPMFNEIGVQVELEEGPLSSSNTVKYTLVLHLKPEFWYPFPSEDNKPEDVPDLTMLPPQSPGCGGALNNAAFDVWVRAAMGPAGTPNTGIRSAAIAPTYTPDTLTVDAEFGRPFYADNSDEMLIRIPLEPIAGGELPPGLHLFIRSVRLNKPLKLQYGTTAVDATPNSGFGYELLAEIAAGPGNATDWVSMGVTDPRLNHDENEWLSEDEGSFLQTNKVAEAAMAAVPGGIPPGQYFYCRNAPMLSPGEIGYLSNGRPWEAPDIFSDDGIALMNRLICDPGVYEIVDQNGAFFTNGTINPYTRSTNVLNAAFYGLDMREVPGMDGEPEDDERLSADDIINMVEAMIQEDVKNGPAGWARVLNTSGLLPDVNKNNLISIFNNTWGLFNESDRLFVVVVVAQAIREGETASGVGNWDPAEDMITGERRAVALCWLDGSADVGGQTLAQEMNVVIFQYLNE